MSKTVIKILRTGIIISFLTICALGVILFFTHSLLIMKILLTMGSIFLLVALAIWILEFTRRTS